MFTAFLSLHLIGAHSTYEHAPPGDWLQALFEVQRNHYDRIVHFCFGLLIAHPFREILLRAAAVRPAWSRFLAVNCILAFSAFYELLEAGVATLVSPELGAAYLGTQGDSWDAQKDAFLAFSGALLAMILSGFRTRSALRS